MPVRKQAISQEKKLDDAANASTPVDSVSAAPPTPAVASPVGDIQEPVVQPAAVSVGQKVSGMAMTMPANSYSSSQSGSGMSPGSSSNPRMNQRSTTPMRPRSSAPRSSSMGQSQASMPQAYQNQSSGYSSNYGGGYSNGYNSTSRPMQSPPVAVDESQIAAGEVVPISGMLEMLPDYGVIRQKKKYDENLPRDVYISHSQVKRFNLRMGDVIQGLARLPKEGERYLSLLKIESVEGVDLENSRRRPVFTEMTPIFPNFWMRLETAPDIISTRVMDLISPIGKGQRAMVVAPPKAGKTWLLKDIANGISTNYPDIILLVALIGERPEEVTHFSRSVKGEVFASNFDENAEVQTKVAELCLERAKRLAERGKDVVILMDSLTRLARAYNMVAPPSGRTLTGGFDPAALYPAKHFFGAARNFEEGGSLTIVATALVETGSRMDDVIFEEFKGTGNMELRLDRNLAERRIYPAIDIKASGTRHEEQLFDKDTLDMIVRLRRMVSLLDDKDATELVTDRLKKTKSNKDFLDTLHKGA